MVQQSGHWQAGGYLAQINPCFTKYITRATFLVIISSSMSLYMSHNTIPDIFVCNLSEHCPILIIFGILRD